MKKLREVIDAHFYRFILGFRSHEDYRNRRLKNLAKQFLDRDLLR